MKKANRTLPSCRNDAVQVMSDLGLDCPPDFDPRRSCIACQRKFPSFKLTNLHVRNSHPELYDHYRSIVSSWSKEC